MRTAVALALLLSSSIAAAHPGDDRPAPTPPSEPPPPSEPTPPTEPSSEPTPAKGPSSEPTSAEPPVPPTPAPASVAARTPGERPAESVLKWLDVKPGGYLQVDGRRLLNGAETHELTVRRLRFDVSGTATPRFKFRTLIDFAGSKLVVKNAWVEYDLRPEFGLRAGKDKGQFGLERLQSTAQLTFLERAFPTDLSPDRDIGLWARGDLQGGLVHYAVGAVDGVADNAVAEGETDNHLEYNIHVLVSPFAQHKELGDLAIGGATTFGRTVGSAASTGLTNIKSAGQSTIVKYTADPTADTALAVGYRTRFTAHGYYYGGPVGVLAEYVIDREPIKFGTSDRLYTNQAWQLATSVAVTPGDHPSFRSIKPKQRFDPSTGGFGAVELAARYTELRLDKDGIAAGITTAKTSAEKAREVTFGVNWYWNEYLKLQIDYSFTTFVGGTATGNRESEQVIAARVQAAI